MLKKFRGNVMWFFGAAVCLGLSFGVMNAVHAGDDADEEEGGTDAAAADAKDGQAIFMAYKCNKCHSIATLNIEHTTKSDKIKGSDLGGIVAEAEKDWVVKFLKKEAETKEGKKHKKLFAGTPEQMETLINWLREQKKAP